MSVPEIIGGVAMIILSIVIILLVMFQESPKGGGMGALTGGDSYFNKNQSRTLDAMLSKWTKYAAILFFVITIGVYAAEVYMK